MERNMSRESTLPRVIWLSKDGKHRIVQTAPGKYSPEERKADDAMGQPSWTWVMWSSDSWLFELADDYCKMLGSSDG